METTGIYYFSGTGNCLAIAKQIAQALGNTEITAITAKLIEENKTISYNNCIVIFPAYGYGMPSILYKFFRQLSIKADYLAALVSCGSQPGSALLHAKRLCGRKDKKCLDYGAKIKSVENYIPIFGLKPDEDLKNLIENQSRITENIINDLKAKKMRNSFWFIRPFTRFVSVVFRAAIPLLVKGYKVSDDCVKCGICRDICPVNAIKMADGEIPSFDRKKCEHCQACLNWCPKRAINFVRLKPSSRRYHHPDISLKEMLSAAECKTIKVNINNNDTANIDNDIITETNNSTEN